MIIYPAIDISFGNCVRLVQGDFNEQTIYSANPLEVALNWESKKAEYLHLVDLDGAKNGSSHNLDIVFEIAERLNIPIQFGGGVRSIGKIDLLLSRGIERVILGTSAIDNKKLLRKAVGKYGNKIAVAIDIKDGKIAVEGWVKLSPVKIKDYIKELENEGVRTVIFTDISKDGMLTGPDVQGTANIISSTFIDVIASGGVSSLNDIRLLKQIGAKGVIIGKALYNKTIDIEEALKC